MRLLAPLWKKKAKGIIALSSKNKNEFQDFLKNEFVCFCNETVSAEQQESIAAEEISQKRYAYEAIYRKH